MQHMNRTMSVDVANQNHAGIVYRGSTGGLSGVNPVCPSARLCRAKLG
jgi:hypothetical protein